MNGPLRPATPRPRPRHRTIAPPRRRRRVGAVVAALALTVTAAACSGDDVGSSATDAPIGTDAPTGTEDGATEDRDGDGDEDGAEDPGSGTGADDDRPVPAILADGFLMGWWTGTGWHDVTGADGEPIEDVSNLVGEPYRFLGRDGDTTDAELGFLEEACPFTTGMGRFDATTRDRVGLPAGYDLLPRAVDEITPVAAHYDAVEDWMREAGNLDRDPTIVAAWRFDVEGDGVDEVIIEARDGVGGDGFADEPDAYSALLYRYVADDVAHTVVLGGDNVSGEEFANDQPWVVIHELVAIADLNEDGRFELVTSETYYEGVGATVSTLDGGDVEQVLVTGCGA